MVFVYIENYSFLTKIIQYLEYANISYTTDSSLNYSYILLAEINNKTKKIIEENPDKKIIFVTYLEENKIHHHFMSNNKRSRMYRNRYYNFFSKCYKLIVSLPYFKELFKNYVNYIDVIPYEIPIINISRNTKDIYQKYDLSKRKKKIIVIDLYYNHLEYLYYLSNRYSKYEFIYIGYKSNYLLTKKEKSMLHSISDNVRFTYYLDKNIFSDLCKIGYMIIDFDSYSLDRDYLYMSILFKRHLLIPVNNLYTDFLIPSKHYYQFNSKDDLFLRMDKIIDERVMNLSDMGYFLIRDFTFYETLKKYRESLQ